MAPNRRTRAAAAVAAALPLGLGACTPHPVGPARTFADYEGKAVTTAEAARSSVETARLAAEAGGDDHAFGPYLSVLLSDQEAGLSGVQGTFASVQPPDGRADDLGAELDELLGRALDDLVAVRIAVRRGQLDGLAALAEPLATDSADLAAFIEAHGS
jgi:hypothetical protein